MKVLLKQLRDELVMPLIRRPRPLQMAALCLRERRGEREVLLVTSRGTGRWILPKGWPEKGLEGVGSALQEAWEEAGVKRASASAVPVGRYLSTKRHDSGLDYPCDVAGYEVEVLELAKDYPEREQRRRVWVSPAEASRMVEEPGLKAILAGL